jgi:deoxyribonuclease IV
LPCHLATAPQLQQTDMIASGRVVCATDFESICSCSSVSRPPRLPEKGVSDRIQLHTIFADSIVASSRAARSAASKHIEGMSNEQHGATLSYDASDEYRPEPPPTPQDPARKDGSVRIGIHTSIAGDIVRALDTALALGANALQIFSASPRMWARGIGRLSEADASRFRARRLELQLGPVVVHGNYLINLGSRNPVLRTRSMQAFHQEIVRATSLGADYLVAHPGSFGDGAVESAIAAIAQGLKLAARGLRLGGLQILLENTAGQGSSIGSKFEELRAILDSCPELPLGVCMDTAHIFAAGWDIRTREGLESALRDIERTIGLERVAVIHVNDSKTPLGSRVDRHEHIGEGKIGSEAFRRILNHPLLRGRPFILETPMDKPGDGRKNVARLWKLVGKDVPSVARNPKKPKAAKRPVARKRLSKGRARPSTRK